MRLDPPSVKFTLKGRGVEKMQALIRTGRQQDFEADELVALSTNIGLFAPAQQLVGRLTMRAGPSASENGKQIPMGLTFGEGLTRWLMTLFSSTLQEVVPKR